MQLLNINKASIYTPTILPLFLGVVGPPKLESPIEGGS
jgi:hypothetical protein